MAELNCAFCVQASSYCRNSKAHIQSEHVEQRLDIPCRTYSTTKKTVEKTELIVPTAWACRLGVAIVSMKHPQRITSKHTCSLFTSEHRAHQSLPHAFISRSFPINITFPLTVHHPGSQLLDTNFYL